MTSAVKNIELIFFILALLQVIRAAARPCARRYFLGATPAGRVVQNAVNVVVNEQKQPLAQGLVNAAYYRRMWWPPGSLFRNCRAETVPAQRTAVTMAASNVDLMVFLHNCAPLTI